MRTPAESKCGLSGSGGFGTLEIREQAREGADVASVPVADELGEAIKTDVCESAEFVMAGGGEKNAAGAAVVGIGDERDEAKPFEFLQVAGHAGLVDDKFGGDFRRPNMRASHHGAQDGQNRGIAFLAGTSDTGDDSHEGDDH
ncbi:MAG: hypothetical protein WA823_04165 [Candidatus Acidiferrales bacterium]